ncbi:ATP-binding protein [Thermoleophilum album]|uniref:Anti-sigma regulatory factor (Ser/Thr protein kinase) n=1 Tax=Thermoleophilum album TaxID=29539 RepID=A0A1H6FUQ6_THEAL|nr:ATP-binding protein [Thermoleophilum album]SEH14152.1 Anti-sigma regulatory factor (Ser/Thr protein kinase) [Thermoleophilum album]
MGRRATASALGSRRLEETPTRAVPAANAPRRKRHVEDVLSIQLPGGPKAASQARRALWQLRGDLDQPLLETARLLVTELISNSVKHARSATIGMKAAVGRSKVLIEIADEGPGFEHVPRGADDDQASGWGLFLVDRLADRWGVTREDGRTRVWFELRRA